MSRRPLEKLAEDTLEEQSPRTPTSPSTEIALRDTRFTQDTDHASAQKARRDVKAQETTKKANQQLLLNKQGKFEHTPPSIDEDSAMELNPEEIEDATEEETKAVLLREARMMANKVVPDLYIGKTQRQDRAKTIDQQLEKFGLALAKARLENQPATIRELEKQVTTLRSESDRLSRYATAEEELTARIMEMEAFRDKLKAQKKRVSPIEATLADLQKVQARLTEAVTWEDPKEAARRKRDKAYQELRLQKQQEATQKEKIREGYVEGMEFTHYLMGGKGDWESKKEDSIDVINRITKRSKLVSALRGKKLQPGAQDAAAEKKLEENLDTLASVFKSKYGGDIARAAREEETFTEKAIGWWKDSRVGRLFQKKDLQKYGGVDRNKTEMVERYNRLLNTYSEVGGRPKRTESDVVREWGKWYSERDSHKTQTQESNLSSTDGVLKTRGTVAKELIRPLAEMAAMPVLAIAEPILRERKWAKEWNEINSRREGPLAAELVNEIARSVIHNEDGLQYVAESMKIAPEKLDVSDVAEFFYITEEGERLREQLMDKLRKEMTQRTPEAK